METNRTNEKGGLDSAALKLLFSRRLIISVKALPALNGDDMLEALGKHLRGNQGSVSEEERKNVDLAFPHGGAIPSGYRDRNGVKFLVVTDHLFSETEIMLPEELCF